MGELILCRTGIAAMPYYIEGISLNIYSMEELCYVIQKNIERLDESFFTEELCTWIEEELSCEEMAAQLRREMHAGAEVADMVLVLADACGYFRKAEKREIEQQLRELENKSEFEKGKLRADRYLKNRRYVSSIAEYRNLLRVTENVPLQALETGSIWHNMGVANAQMFLYEQAAECFKKAYAYNNNPESLTEMYFALQCVSEKGNAAEYEPPEEWKECVMTRLQQAVNELEKNADEQSIPEAAAADRITEWKNQYRRYSKR